MAQKHKTTVDQDEWRQILKQVHGQTIPIVFDKIRPGLAQLYANHTLIFEIKEQLVKLHKTILRDMSYALRKQSKEIQINVIALNNNQIGFISLQGKKTQKDTFKNYCIDCKTHREQILIRDLKRKLNINKFELNINHIGSTNNGNDNNSQHKKDYKNIKNTNDSNNQTNIDRQIQDKVINNYQRVKQQINQNLQQQQRRQNIFQHQNQQPHKVSSHFTLKKSNSTHMYQNQKTCYNNISQQRKQDDLQNDILMNEKQNYLQQVNALLEGRQVHQTSNTQAYSYLINELMQLPNLDKLNQEIYSKQAQRITEKIQKQLFQNFMATLSNPLKQIFKKVLGKKYLQINHESHESNNQNIIKVKRINVQVQTSSLSFQQKIKHLQKQLQRKNYQLNYIKSNKEELQKKYIEKYQEQRQNQKQIHQNFVTMKQLQRKLQNLLQEKEIVEGQLQKQKSLKAITMKNMENQHNKRVNQLKKATENKYKQYREKLNEQVHQKILKIKTQKDDQINYLKTLTQIKFGQYNVGQQNTSLNAIINFQKYFSSNQKSNNIQVEGQTNKQINGFNLINSTLQDINIKSTVMLKQTSKQSQNNHNNQSLQNYKKQSKNKQKQVLSKTDPWIKNDDRIIQSRIRNLQVEQQFRNARKYIFEKQKEKENSTKSIDLMIKLNQSIEKDINRKVELGSQTYLLKRFQRQQRKTANEIFNFKKQKSNKQKDMLYQKIQTQNSSPQKDFSSRNIKIKKIPFLEGKLRTQNKKQSISFRSKNQISEYSVNDNQPLEQNIKNQSFYEDTSQKIFHQVSLNKLNAKNNQMIRSSNLKKSIAKIQEKVKKGQLRSVVKFKSIIIGGQNNNQELKQEKQAVNDKKNSPQQLQQEEVLKPSQLISSHKQRLQNLSKPKHKYIKTPKNESIQVQSNNLSFSISEKQYWKKSNFTHRAITLNSPQKNKQDPFLSTFQRSYGQNGFNNTKQHLNNSYNIEQVKSVIQKQFEYFKMTGVIDQLFKLEENQIKSLNKRVLTVVKNILQAKKQKISPPKQKDILSNTKSHKTLKQIISKSMNKIIGMQNLNANESNRHQHQKLKQKYFNELKSIIVFSPLSNQDLDIFGGWQGAEKIQYQQKQTIRQRQKQQSLYIAVNTFNQAQQSQILSYFKKLSFLNKQKYFQYINFLRYPITALKYSQNQNNRMSRKQCSEQNENEEFNSRGVKNNKQVNFANDLTYLKSIINKILVLHQKQHHKKCIHLQKFFKKIGFFKYSGFN